MTEAGFFAQKRRSPTSLAMVVALHAALLAAVIMIRGPVFERLGNTTTVTFIPIDPDPPVEPPPPQPRTVLVSRLDSVPPLVPTTPQGPPVERRPNIPIFTGASGAGDIVLPPPPPPPAPLPVRRGAELDPRFASALQPPYPPDEQRAQRGGRVQVRVTIGPDGRVIAVALLSATSPSFWRVTEQQALRRWRFRPATVDGRPVEDSKVMNLVFRITDAG